MKVKTIGPTGAKINGKESKSLALVLPIGCDKARRKPCNHCALYLKSLGKPEPEGIIREVKEILKIEKNKSPNTGRVEIITHGSLMNGFPFQALMEIVELVSKNGYEEIMLETRPEHITEEKVKRLLSVAGSSSLRFGFGLESWDDHIREDIIGKGIPKLQIYRVMDIFRRLNVRVWLYTFMKPIGLSEQEAIDDCINTVKQVTLAFPEVDVLFALQPAYIAEGSEFARNAYAQNYMPPFLWSIIEFLKRVHDPEFIKEIGRTKAPQIFAGLDDEQLADGNYVKNCPECSGILYKMIDEEYNRTQDIGLFDSVSCSCIQDWRKVCSGEKIETYANTVSNWNLKKLRAN